MDNLVQGKDRVEIIRTANELFNKGDIILAYKCYIMAKYYSGIEKIADHYYYKEKSIAKAIVLYKQILKENENEGYNIRVKQKIEDIALKIVEVIRNWNSTDDTSVSNITEDENFEARKRYLVSVVQNNEKNKFHTKTDARKKSIKNK